MEQVHNHMDYLEFQFGKFAHHLLKLWASFPVLIENFYFSPLNPASLSIPTIANLILLEKYSLNKWHNFVH